MRILHYIHQLKSNDLLGDYLRHLVSALKEQSEVYVATRESDIQESLDESNPDIVHIHGCWDRYAYKLMRGAVRQGFAVVLSPHGEIGTYSMKHERHLEKSAELVAYQRRMVSQAEAILVTSDDEKNSILSLGWQKRIDVIPASILDSSITDEEMAKRMLWFYGKVIDTRYRRMMTDSEKEAVRSLMHVGMAHDENMALLDSDRILTLRGLKPDQWRRLLLYADDEDLRYIFDNAAKRMQLQIPAIDTSKISRYPTDEPKAMGELPVDRLIGGNKLLAHKLKDVTADDPEELREITTMLVNARTLLRKRQMSMRHLAELYDAIKYVDYDESRLVDISKDMKLRKFLRRMLQVLADEVYLEEGFMPDNPLNDSGERTIKSRLLIS